VVAVLQWRQVGQEVEIFDVAVDATHRRQGIASILLESVLGLARERGAKEFFMEVRESNDAALALYRTLGFSITGRRPNYYRDPDAAALLLRLDVTG
jgi:ribosomal protein S18 acetylase RimI-like enzyme